MRGGTSGSRGLAMPGILYHKTWNGWSDGISFFNNLVVNECPQAVYDTGESKNNHYDHNLFYGLHPASEPVDAHKLTADPLLAKKPGSAGAGLDAAAGVYALRAGS